MATELGKHLENFNDVRDKVIAAEAYFVGFTAGLELAKKTKEEFDEAMSLGRMNEYIEKLNERRT